MSNRVGQAANKALRSVLGFAAARVASSDRLMSVVYDLMNETNFAGLSEHEEMLSDTVRVQTYHRGIRNNVRPGDVVVDLGTGTGLLAFMASRAGAKKVYAVEHSDFIEVAREIGRHNGFTNIEFVQANSREFTPPEPVDIVLHEQMGDELFNENMLQNLLDVRDRLLRPHGRILPAKFRLYVEPVTLHESMRVRRFWNIELPDGIDLSPMRDSPTAGRRDTGRHEQIWLRPGSVAATFGDPSAPGDAVNVTATPTSGDPLSSFKFTRSGIGNRVPGAPDCASPRTFVNLGFDSAADRIAYVVSAAVDADVVTTAFTVTVRLGESGPLVEAGERGVLARLGQNLAQCGFVQRAGVRRSCLAVLDDTHADARTL